MYNILRLITLVVSLMLARATAMAQTNTVMSGNQSNLGVEAIPGASYSWDLYTDNTAVNFATVPGNCPVANAYFMAGNTAPTVSVMWLIPGIYYFRVSVLDAGGCLNLKLGRMEVLSSLPTATFVDPPPICAGQITNLKILLTGAVPWSLAYTDGVSPVVITGIAASPLLIPVSPSFTTNYWITSVNDANGTPNTTLTGPSVVVVKQPPVVVFAPCFDTITTTGAKPFKLNGGLPPGGSYSGAGVNTPTGMFDPAAAGTGDIPVTYFYTNFAGCSDSAVRQIHSYAAQALVCGATFTDIRDNTTYPTIQIGAQCWLAANLNFGTTIQASQVQVDNCISEKYCYSNLAANCAALGGLYQWDELMKYNNAPASQGICPPGWHVPAEAEWLALFNFYGGTAFAARSLMDPAAIGFHALPGGVLYQNNTWSFKDMATLFWSSTPISPIRVISHGMNIYDTSVSYYELLKNNAFPARCLRD